MKMSKNILKLALILSFVYVATCKKNEKPPRLYVSKEHEKQLEVLARELTNTSVNPNKYPCVSYYDYACSRKRPLFSALGDSPKLASLVNLMNALHNEQKNFPAKTKLLSFFTSCHKVKSVDECYRECFDYFKPLFGYIISQKYIDAEDHKTLLNVLENFLALPDHKDPAKIAILTRLVLLKDKLRDPQEYFRTDDLNKEYEPLLIYPESYEHNVKNLEKHRKGNLTYYGGLERKVLEFTLYMFQSRHQPRSYYYPTLNAHLWMILYNTTAKDNPQKTKQMADCFQLPAYIDALEEARSLAVVYFKSFNGAWTEYMDWIARNKEIYDEENEILHEFYIDNKHIFFVIYAQNFCDFGKEIAENVFYQGLTHNYDFLSFNSCEADSPMNPKLRCD